VSGGSTALGLANTQLADEKVPPQQIPHQDFGGTVIVTGTGHDIAVTNVTSHKICIGQGYSSNITVTIGNMGGYAETFNATVYANQTIIATSANTTLSSGSFTNLTFTWDTIGLAYGKYTLSTYAWPVPGETNTSDNTHVGGAVLVTIPGDINGDKTVDIFDAIRLAGAYDSALTNANWNPNADLNNDNIVDIYDAIILSSHYNQRYV
jgi:hypothetical protein